MFITKHPPLRKRSTHSHKGENGRVLVIAGSKEFAGAAFLAGSAAFRSGADWVSIAAPQKVAWTINCLSPDLVTVKIQGDYFTQKQVRKLAKLAEDFDVTLVGNGIGQRKATLRFARMLLRSIRGWKVIDADAIKAIRLQEVSNAILTPHKKELAILLENSKANGNDLREIQSIAGSNVIIAKGAVDRIISKERIAYNRTGSPGMTVAGTGDVLAGLTAGILAQEKDLWRAAVAATYVNGKVGEKLEKQQGYGFTASDMLPLLGKEVYKLQQTPAKRRG